MGSASAMCCYVPRCHEVHAKLQKEMLKTQTDMRAAFSKVPPTGRRTEDEPEFSSETVPSQHWAGSYGPTNAPARQRYPGSGTTWDSERCGE